MKVAVSFFLLFHPLHGVTGQLIIPVAIALLRIVDSVHQGCLRITEGLFFIILVGPDGGFPGPLAEYQAGPSFDTLSTCPQDLL